ncbi:MAG: hypothetical protein HQ522_22080 [Bacteroidetes bacterium]|nr:hypothetical protein [Bacteroidota bacterium]
MKAIKLVVLTILTTFSIELCAWDEVTHAYMTNMIPELIKDAELKQLLQNNLDEYIYGCWYTDTYQYTNNRISSLNPHYIATYGKAFMNYLQKKEIVQQNNYEQLVALYLGSLSHLLEDFWYDSNLNKYQKTKNDKYKGDSKHGAFVAKQNGYLMLKVKRYFPKEDLFNMYKDAGMLQPEFDTIDKFEKLLNAWSNHQYLLLRSLKFINFLGGNQMYNESLWTAGNLKEINGGMQNSAKVAAIFIEEVWKNMRQKQTPKILHADYFEFENKIALLTSVPVNIEDIPIEKIFLLNGSKDTITGSIKQFEHNDRKKGITKYAISFYPAQELKKGEIYNLIVKTNDLFSESFNYKFQPGTYIEKLAKPKPFLSTIGLGLFGFVPILAFAGLFFGIGGIIRFNWSGKNENQKLPVSLFAAQKILQLISVLILLFGFYVLATKGTIIINMSF